MARETRTSAREHTDTAATASSSATIKRKRTSRSPIPALPSSSTSTSGAGASTSLKVVLPSSSTLAAKQGSNDTEDDSANRTKRQKITVKVKPVNGHRTVSGLSDAVSAEEANGDEDVKGASGDVDLTGEETPTGALSSDLRGALVTVISQMAIDLPTPLNGILSLWLPPTFAQKDENTLGWVLRQKDLTWESLVERLHVFAENLLVPCSYPNPMPSLSQFHQPVPPLPSHFRPHVIYNFCASLYALMLQIEPQHRSRLDVKTAERWALMQKVPNSLSSNTSAGDWFTAPADMRLTDAGLKAVKKEGGEGETLLETFAARGDKFGVAHPVSMQSWGLAKEYQVVKLSDTVIRRASLKAAKWKEMRAARAGGGFGGIARGVQAVSLGDSSWTPSFAPTFDSSRATGGGSYYRHVAAMTERSRFNTYKRLAIDSSTQPDYAEGWDGLLKEGKSGAGDHLSKTAEEVLKENAELIEELQAWQEDRVRKGKDDVQPSKREQAIADALLDSLTTLSSAVTPADLVPERSAPGFAHELAQRFIPVSTPSIRGTLDPRRPKAIHDNLTVRPKPIGQPLAGISAALAGGIPSPGASQQQRPAAYQNQATPVRNYNYSPATQNANGANPYRPPGTAYSPTPTNGPIYGRSAPPIPAPSPVAPQTTPSYPSGQYPVRPGPGPSALRQSFGPVTSGAMNGSSYGRNPAAGLMSQVGMGYRPQQ